MLADTLINTTVVTISVVINYECLLRLSLSYQTQLSTDKYGPSKSCPTDDSLNRQNAAWHLIQNMFGCAAQKLVHSMGLDPAHHDHIHLVFISELTQCLDRMPLNEMSTIRGHSEPICQPQKRILQVTAKHFGEVSEGQAAHVRQKSGRNIARVQQMKVGITLHRKAACLLNDTVVQLIVG